MKNIDYEQLEQEWMKEYPPFDNDKITFKEWLNMKRIPPRPPLDVVRRERVFVFCPNCHSSMSRTGFLGLFGKRKCDNLKCPNSK